MVYNHSNTPFTTMRCNITSRKRYAIYHIRKRNNGIYKIKKKIRSFKIIFQFISIVCVVLLLPVNIQQNQAKPMKEYKELSR
jgi:hypothetical protein